jgi:hypothetical protein
MKIKNILDFLVTTIIKLIGFEDIRDAELFFGKPISNCYNDDLSLTENKNIIVEFIKKKNFGRN